MNSKVKIIKLLRAVEREIEKIKQEDMPAGSEEWRWMTWGKSIVYQSLIEDICLQLEVAWLRLGSEDYFQVFKDSNGMKAFKHRDKVEEMKETEEGRNKDEKGI